MISLPGDTFTMGSPENEGGRDDDEGPRHEVTVQPFAIGQYEVTFDEWDACVEAGGCSHRPKDEGWGRGGRPVINVSWNDAQEYVAWMKEKTRKPYRLPTEAEWEYAARAGTWTPFWTGATISPEQANYDGNYTYGSGRKGEYRQRTTPVDTFEANPWGLHDVHGNVWEWCEDCWNDSYRGAPLDGSAWLEPNCSLRVVRGGSWKDSPGFLRSAVRFRYGSGNRNGRLGFRVSRALTP